MIKRGTLFPLVVLLALTFLLLTACQSKVNAGEKPLDTAAALRAVQTGTQGIEIELLSNYPPNTIYDENELVAIVEVKNKGNYDLDQTDCFIQVTGFDPNIIKGGFHMPRSCAENIGTLEGKDVYNTEGGFNQIEFTSPSVNLPLKVFEYNPILNFVSCYNYHTTANPEVCVDPQFYQVTSEQKTCIPQDVSTGGGQGAPVGISYVGVDMIGEKAIFEINVINQGGGRVLSPFANIQNCGQASLDYQDLDKVVYRVQLSGGSLIDCKPRDGTIRLNNNQGKIVCSFRINSPSAFKTPLMIDLDYGYINSFQKSIKIVRTPE